MWIRTEQGLFPGLFDEDFGFEKYAEFLLNMPVIFVENQGTPIYTGDQKTEEIWKETLFGQEDIEHILSMNFQDVRLKHYLEIRYADSMPINCVLGYAALIKGVFYQEEFLKELHKKLRPDEGIHPADAEKSDGKTDLTAQRTDIRRTNCSNT